MEECIRKEAALKLAGSAKQLAEILGITRAAISQWAEFVPEDRYWKLRVKRPDWFHEDGSPKA
jgi:transcriptional regulator with XRE-family HTH domain